MSKYKELLNNPPVFTKLYDSENLREVIFETISCMCDNKGFLKLKKNNEGDFKLSGNGFAISNWQMQHAKHDIEWEADAANWGMVVNMINTGTSKIASIKNR
jgi:ssDNA-binding Zn-finger/Zn-ribbon topoisomerase 1